MSSARRFLVSGFLMSVLLVGSAGARSVCGADPGDAAAVAAVENQIAGSCDCCSVTSPRRPCARAVVRAAVHARTLPARCVAMVIRDTRFCPAIACRACTGDADCTTTEFCECAAGTCGAGVCRATPQACPQYVRPVCGCDGTTYPNDCIRASARACKLHDGACATPVGRCFVTVDNACSDEPCDASHPCRNPNEICRADCLATTTTTTVASSTTTTLPGACLTDADCNDGNACTADQCVNGVCENGCICLTPGGPSCCPGPAALCARPCGADTAGTCGGTCPSGASCSADAPNGCGCVSGLGGPCGGNLLKPPPVCAPGLVCRQSNPDVTGVCVAASCIPFFQPGCTQTSDCCRPCGNGVVAPCGVCLNGVCEGAP